MSVISKGSGTVYRSGPFSSFYLLLFFILSARLKYSAVSLSFSLLRLLLFCLRRQFLSSFFFSISSKSQSRGRPLRLKQSLSVSQLLYSSHSFCMRWRVPWTHQSGKFVQTLCILLSSSETARICGSRKAFCTKSWLTMQSWQMRGSALQISLSMKRYSQGISKMVHSLDSYRFFFWESLSIRVRSRDSGASKYSANLAKVKYSLDFLSLGFFSFVQSSKIKPMIWRYLMDLEMGLIRMASLSISLAQSASRQMFSMYSSLLISPSSLKSSTLNSLQKMCLFFSKVEATGLELAAMLEGALPRLDLSVRVRAGWLTLSRVARNTASSALFSMPFLLVSKLSKSVNSHLVSMWYPLMMCCCDKMYSWNSSFEMKPTLSLSSCVKMQLEMNLSSLVAITSFRSFTLTRPSAPYYSFEAPNYSLSAEASIPFLGDLDRWCSACSLTLLLGLPEPNCLYLSHVNRLFLTVQPIRFLASFSNKYCWYFASYSASLGSLCFLSSHSSSKSTQSGSISCLTFDISQILFLSIFSSPNYLSTSMFTFIPSRLGGTLPLSSLYLSSIGFIDRRWASNLASIFSRLIVSRLDLTWMACWNLEGLSAMVY